jgi:hypothetical protein
MGFPEGIRDEFGKSGQWLTILVSSRDAIVELAEANKQNKLVTLQYRAAL